jgi:hypothetical protein
LKGLIRLIRYAASLMSGDETSRDVSTKKGVYGPLQFASECWISRDCLCDSFDSVHFNVLS